MNANPAPALAVERLEPQKTSNNKRDVLEIPDTSREQPALATDESLYLMGLPKLRHFLRFCKHQAIEPEDEESLIDQWKAAKEHYSVLRERDAGAADGPGIESVARHKEYEPLLIELLKDPQIRNGFNTVPTDVAFIDLDKLIVYQRHIDLTYVGELQRQLESSSTDADVFRTCLPYDHPKPPNSWSRIDEETYVYVSRSNDLRFLGAMPLEPENVQGVAHPGTVLGFIGLAVGFGSNFLNVIHAGGRLILHNGSHRAYALRAMGFTRVPCLLQHASSRDDFSLLVPSDVASEADFYLKHPRPPMFKDYFDPELRKTVEVKQVLRQVKIRFSVSEHYIPTV